MTRRSLWLGVALVAFARAMAVSGQTPEALSAREQRGRDIYFGVAAGPESKIRAVVGIPPMDAPPRLLACASCHGRDGTGKREGSVVPSDITWDALTKPYGVTHASGRTHRPYTERLLVRAISMGLDPAGNVLNPAMPRFQISREDAVALILYLKRLVGDSDAGVDDSTIRVATLVPETGPFAEAGRAVGSLLTAYFDSINRQGGIFGRRLELSVATLGESAADALTAIETLMSDRRPFAMVGGVITGVEPAIVAVAESHRVPFVGPLTVSFDGSRAANEHTFYLLSGIEQQGRALIDYSRQGTKTSAGSMAIVFSERVVPPAMVRALQAYGTHAGWTDVRVFNHDRDDPGSDALVSAVSRSKATHILLMAGGRELRELAVTTASPERTPVLLIPGSMATNDVWTLPATSEGRVFLALPSLPSDQTQAGLSEYRTLADAYRLPGDQVASQIAALGSAKVLTHALKLAGRTLSREKLMTALEGLTDFDTGLMPKVGFGPNRRVGAPGAYIVTVDANAKQFRQVAPWVGVE